MTENSEDENCDKKLMQNDAGPSQNKSHDKHKTHSLDECAKNTAKRLRGIPKHANINTGKKKCWTLNLEMKILLTRHQIQKNKIKQENECQSLCLCNQKYIWDSDEKNITDVKSGKKCVTNWSREVKAWWSSFVC